MRHSLTIQKGYVGTCRDDEQKELFCFIKQTGLDLMGIMNVLQIGNFRRLCSFQKLQVQIM